METTKRGETDIPILRPSTRKLDVTTSESFYESAISRLAEGTRLVLDLSDVEFIDSSGLGKIVGLLRAFREKGGDIRICGAQPTVTVLFEMVRLGEIVGIDADSRASAAALAEATGSPGP